MAFTVGQIYECRWFSSMQGQVGLAVKHVVVTAVAGAPLLQTIADAMSAAVGNLIRLCMCDTAEYNGLLLKQVAVTPEPEATPSVSSAGVGATAGDPLPKQVSGLISLRTTLAGRANRGRWYVPFPSVADNTADDTPQGAYLTAIGNLGTWWIGTKTYGAGGNTVTMQGGVYHRASQTITPFTHTILPVKWATQRRRSDFGRPNISPI